MQIRAKLIFNPDKIKYRYNTSVGYFVLIHLCNLLSYEDNRLVLL